MRVLLSVVIGLVLGAGGQVDSDAERAAAMNAFEAYKLAIMNDRGAVAAELLSIATADYYAEMRDLALYASSVELRGQSTMNLMQALILRHRVPLEKLRVLSGRDLLVHAIDQGWVGKNSVAPFNAQKAWVSGSTAVVDVLNERSGETLQMRFVEETGSWKLDLLPLLQVSNVQLDSFLEQQGLDREDFILQTLSSLSGTAVPSSIWQPLLGERPRN